MLQDRYDIVVSGRWPGKTLTVADRTFKTVAQPDPNTWLMREAETDPPPMKWSDLRYGF